MLSKTKKFLAALSVGIMIIGQVPAALAVDNYYGSTTASTSQINYQTLLKLNVKPPIKKVVLYANQSNSVSANASGVIPTTTAATPSASKGNFYGSTISSQPTAVVTPPATNGNYYGSTGGISNQPPSQGVSGGNSNYYGNTGTGTSNGNYYGTTGSSTPSLNYYGTVTSAANGNFYGNTGGVSVNGNYYGQTGSSSSSNGNFYGSTTGGTTVGSNYYGTTTGGTSGTSGSNSNFYGNAGGTSTGSNSNYYGTTTGGTAAPGSNYYGSTAGNSSGSTNANYYGTTGSSASNNNYYGTTTGSTATPNSNYYGTVASGGATQGNYYGNASSNYYGTVPNATYYGSTGTSNPNYYGTVGGWKKPPHIAVTPNYPTCKRPYPKDIDGHWAEIYIRRLYDLCVVQGYRDGFHPEQKVTRIEFLKMTLYAARIPLKTGCYDADCGTPFMDLAFGWQSAVARTGWDYGIVNGVSADRFAPNDPITREQATKMVLAAFKYQPLNVSSSFFKDVSGWSTGWIELAHELGIVNGTGLGYFDPKRNLTRAEGAKIMALTIEKEDTKIY